MVHAIYLHFVNLLAATAVASAGQGHQGFVGVYHAAHGPVADAVGTDAWDLGSWGSVAIER